MSGRTSQLKQMAAITKVLEIAPYAPVLRNHLQEIINSPTFKGSRRSQEFLEYVVEKALNGQFDELKERTVGVELFGRPASYDTGEDAIVRVTASDVRKRLLQYYGEIGFRSDVRIDLPSGSYIPEFRRVSVSEAAATVPVPAAESIQVVETVRDIAPRMWKRLAPVFALLVAVTIGSLMWMWPGGNSQAHLTQRHGLPWSAILQKDRQVHVILCDPDISTIQRLLDFQISLSDYANRRYVPASASLRPDMQRVFQSFRGVNVAGVDTGIVLNVSELALTHSIHVKTHTARSLQVMDFKTEDNFILLGSPRSNPWVGLFQDQLDFNLVYDEALKQEIVRDNHPEAGESPTYVPTAQGWGTGKAYAIMAFLANPNQSGHVLLLGGSNAEATEAAGKLAANLDLLSRTLKKHGIDPNGPPRHFEILLRVDIIAGSSNTFEVIACHAVPNKPQS
jgi:hypothetical protein